MRGTLSKVSRFLLWILVFARSRLVFLIVRECGILQLMTVYPLYSQGRPLNGLYLQ
jgi:hypothetical protein